MITLLFTARRTAGSLLIRGVTWSSWSHVALVTDDYHVVEAVGTYGVRRVDMATCLEGVHRYAYVAFKEGDSKALEDAMMTQEGKKYDYVAALGIGLHKNWEDDDRWVCSELLAWGEEQIGNPTFRPDQRKKITPEDYWRIKPIGQTLVIRK